MVGMTCWCSCPEHFDEAIEAVMAVREQHTVVLNLQSSCTPDAGPTSRRLSSVEGVHALDGHQQRIGDTVFAVDSLHRRQPEPDQLRTDQNSGP